MVPIFEEVELAAGVRAGFTTRAAGNLSHRRPHLPSRLARSRRAVTDELDLAPSDLHFMRQVHDAEVGIVDSATVRGAEVEQVDALVTAERRRALAVQVADCVPVLIAADRGPVAAVHAGRRGFIAGVVAAALDVLRGTGAAAEELRAVVGPAIGGCCYEVPAEMRDAAAEIRPEAASATTWETPSIDLPAGVRAQLADAGVDVDPIELGCTRCGEGQWWFSHRADPEAGRQLGIVVRTEP